MDFYPEPETIMEDLKFYVSPSLAQRLEEHPELKPVGQTIVINQPLPSLNSLIPPLWHDIIIRSIRRDLEYFASLLPPVDKEAARKRRIGRKHYLGKVAWGKRKKARRR